MTTGSTQEWPSDAELDQIVSAAHTRLHLVMHTSDGRVRPPKKGREVIAGAVAAVLLVGGGAAVANVGPFASGPQAGPGDSGDYSRVTCPADVRGEQNCSAFELTTAPWPSNEFGLTVGEPTRADVIAGNLPDLIPVRTSGSESGFWRSSEVYTYAADGEVENLPAHINVYGPDGKTVRSTS